MVPDGATVHHELKRQGVTLFLLWQEYKAATPDGMQDSWFCHTYKAWASQLDLVMRQTHRAGEKRCVDYAGQGIPIVNPHSGEVHEAAIVVAVLGASNYTYAEATWSQSLPDWIGSHVRTLAALGEVPESVVIECTPSSDGVALRVHPACSNAARASPPPPPSPPPRVKASATAAIARTAAPPIPRRSRFRRSSPCEGGGLRFPCERGFGGMDAQG